MSGPTKHERQDSFIRRYGDRYAQLVQLARLAETYIQSLLEDLPLDLHLVTSRAKSTSSVREKIVRKSYGSPSRQLKDSVGVRVITYYESDVDRVIEKLRKELDIDEGNSIDKRHTLGVREFGYRSVQLVARVSSHGLDRFKFGPLKGLWFEIQVRSILEHAWSEIEHEVVYKAAIKYPNSILRRFASIAGNLEILEREFLALTKVRPKLIQKYRIGYEKGKEKRQPFDAARLLGFLEAMYPDGLSWREAEKSGKPFPPRIEGTCVRALNDVGLSNADRFGRFMKRLGFRRRLRSFAFSHGIATKNVSHLAVVQIAVQSKDQGVFASHFPEFDR